MKENAIWIFIEKEEEQIRRVSLELLSREKSLSTRTASWLLWFLAIFSCDMTTELSGYGADIILNVPGDGYEIYGTDAYTDAMEALIRRYTPNLLLVGATTMAVTSADVWQRVWSLALRRTAQRLSWK